MSIPARVLEPVLRCASGTVLRRIGIAVTLLSAALMIAGVTLRSLELVTSRYVGVVAYLVMPAIYMAGLLLSRVGALTSSRNPDASIHCDRQCSRWTLLRSQASALRLRQIAGAGGALSFCNILLLGTTGYNSVEYMDSVEFCGKVCHDAMEPQLVSYQNSSHARVACTECHVGPGASWFVWSKLNGVGEMTSYALDTFERPIATPIDNLRPSRDTCENCHWPEKFNGDRMRVITHFADDEYNTPRYTVLLMHVGGGGVNRDIHSWHVDSDRQISYVARDRQRQEIVSVSVRDELGGETVFATPAVDGELQERDARDVRVMDCVDCHNRPSHVFEMPEAAVDAAIQSGRIDRTLPFIRKTAVEALRDVRSDSEDLARISMHVSSYFAVQHPEVAKEKSAAISAAVREVQAIYRRNVFPQMNVTWGTYIDNLGHSESQGCFRCHDGNHQTKDGRTITQDCTVCHSVISMDEEDPEILADLGIPTTEEDSAAKTTTSQEG